MTVALDAVGAGEFLSTGSLNWLERIGPDADALVVFAFPTVDSASLWSSTWSAAVGDVPMKRLAFVPSFVTDAGTYSWNLVAFGILRSDLGEDFPVGDQSVTVTQDAGGARIVANSVSYSGVHGFGDPITAVGANTPASMSVPAGRAYAQAFAATSYPLGFSNYNQTSRSNIDPPPTAAYPLIIGDSLDGSASLFTADFLPQDTSLLNVFAGIAIPLLDAPKSGASMRRYGWSGSAVGTKRASGSAAGAYGFAGYAGSVVARNVFRVAAENRTFTVDAENRSFAVAFENRDFMVT